MPRNSPANEAAIARHGEESTPAKLPPLHAKAVALLPKLEREVEAYVAWAEERLEDGKSIRQVPSLAGLASWLGIYKETLPDWARRAQEGDSRYAPAERAYKKMQLLSEAYLYDNCVQKRNAMALAMLKCNHGYVEAGQDRSTGNFTIVIDTGLGQKGKGQAHEAEPIDVQAHIYSAANGQEGEG